MGYRAGPITHFDTENSRQSLLVRSKVQCREFLRAKGGRKYDACSQYGIVAADEAIADAGFDLTGGWDPDRVIWASGIGVLKHSRRK